MNGSARVPAGAFPTGRFVIIGLSLLLGLALGPLRTLPALAEPSALAVPPTRQNVFTAAEHQAWTLFTNEGSAPLSLSLAGEDRILVGFTGGWLLLGADLRPIAQSLWLLGRSEAVLKAGSPWACGWTGGVVVFLDGGALTVSWLDPEEGLVFSKPLDIPGLSVFNAVPNAGLFFYQSRKAWVQDLWPREPYPYTPLTFFPREVTTSPETGVWGLDILGNRIWKVEDGFWVPMAEPQTPAKAATLAGGPGDTTFLAGPGWLGAFDPEGHKIWLMEKDLTGAPLPPDPKLLAGPRGLYLWSGLRQKIWYFSWETEGPKIQKISPPSVETIFEWINTGLERQLDALHYPEAEALSSHGLAIAEKHLRASPSAAAVRSSQNLLRAVRQDLRRVLVGFGALEWRWSLPYGVPLADWSLQADESAREGELHFKSRLFDAMGQGSVKEGTLARTAHLAPWPGIGPLSPGPTWGPQILEILLTHPGTGQRGYFRILLPVGGLPEPPDEKPKVPERPQNPDDKAAMPRSAVPRPPWSDMPETQE